MSSVPGLIRRRRREASTALGSSASVRQPFGRLDHVVERCSAFASHEGNDLRLLRSGPGLARSRGLFGRLLLRLASALGFGCRFVLAQTLIRYSDRGGARLRDLESERLVLLVVPPGQLIALDPHLLQEPEPEELRDRCLSGARLQALRQSGKAVLPLRGRRQDDELGVVELRGGRLRHDALRWLVMQPSRCTTTTPPFLGSGVRRALRLEG